MPSRSRPSDLWLFWLTGEPAMAVLRTDAYASIYAVAITLAVHADDDCVSEPGWAVVQAETELSRRTVARHLAWLRRHGWVKALPQVGANNPGRYELTRPGLPSPPD